MGKPRKIIQLETHYHTLLALTDSGEIWMWVGLQGHTAGNDGYRLGWQLFAEPLPDLPDTQTLPASDAVPLSQEEPVPAPEPADSLHEKLHEKHLY